MGAEHLDPEPTTEPEGPRSTLKRILSTARWAPSGDNTQPWRFETPSDDHIVVHGRDTREHCVYDLDGRASQVSLGALLETMAIAASHEGLHAVPERRTTSRMERPVFDVRLHADPTTAGDPLFAHIRTRSTQRRPMDPRPLTAIEAQTLKSAVGHAHELVLLEQDKKRVARMLSRSALIRLTIHEAYLVHRKVIEFGATFSQDRIPGGAVGLDHFTMKLMAWTMKSWGRVRFMNRYLAGTAMPRYRLDYLPGIRCAAHFLLVARAAPGSIDAQVSAGRALQRFWLTATSLGLHVQPEMTPLIFSRYVRDGIRFTTDEKAMQRALQLNEDLGLLFGAENLAHAVFFGRVGAGDPPKSRSLRLPLEQLME